jgi:hypothetical protein
MNWKKRVLFYFFILFLVNAKAQINTGEVLVEDNSEEIFVPSKNWYEIIQLRGYAQVRYNRLFETNPSLMCDQCDKSWGENGGFFFRRIRLIFYGNVHEKVYFYIQPDFASAGSNLAQIRDAYFDLAFDQKKEFRIRIGQSKVPYGFENMQSSQNRLALDRNDALNSAVSNERDIGFFLYWAPSHVRDRFAELVKLGLKGSGDYGVLGVGLYNGQTANQPERNNSPHIATRATYPFQFKNGQIIETSLQAYSGEFVINTQLTDQKSFREDRIAGSIIYYPQPFGFQAEYNIGKGPEFNPETMTVDNKNLKGGYVQAMYYLKTNKHLFIPFVKWQMYSGGKKHELDATKHRVNEQEIGIEWQPHKNFELVTMYTFSDRTFENSIQPFNRQSGRLLRIQAQVNF